MNAPVLIVRTVSVEKLSPVLDACVARWPGHPLVVVTSAGRAGELWQDPRVADIVAYAVGPGGFDTPIEFAEKLTAVVVPVGNRGGSGYANVLRACRRLDVGTRWLASYAKELRPVGAVAWGWRWRSELALGWFARGAGLVWRWWLLRGLG